MSLSRMLPQRPMVGGYREMVGIHGRQLFFQLSLNRQKIILEKITFTSADGDEGTCERRFLELNMHHAAVIVQNKNSCREGMKCIMNNEKIFSILPVGDDIFLLWDPQEMKQAPYTMQFRMMYPKSDGTLFADGSPRLLKSRSGVNCYGEEGLRYIDLFEKALPMMEPPQEEPVRCLTMKRAATNKITDDDDDGETSDVEGNAETVTTHNDGPSSRKKAKTATIKSFTSPRKTQTK